MTNIYCKPRTKLVLLKHRAGMYVSNRRNTTRTPREWSLQEYMDSVRMIPTKRGERYYRRTHKGNYVKDIYRATGTYFRPTWNYGEIELPF